MTEKKIKMNNSRCDSSVTLRELKKKIILRAGLILATVLLTAVLFFSLTAAWYTNVAGAGGLTFESKQWNFNGRISFGESDIMSMAPGDSGIIPMQISNDGEEIAAASVTVSKEQLNDKMQERLYFYVDTVMYRNGERMDRVYISENSSYTYTLLPGSEVIITEDSHNAPVLKWEWVYDVLGYYVLGTVTDSGEDIVEYIRPIEYDYDFTSTTFDENGALQTIDGITTVDEFAVQISKNDGYAGEIDVSEKKNGYYPVYVNSSGYGVWAYLCSYTEIINNMEYDTQIGEGETEQGPYSVDIKVTGSNSQETMLEINDKATFLAVIENSNYSNVKLTNNITLEEPVDVARGSRVNIDLNQYTISSSQDSVFNVEEGSKLTLVNGTVNGTGAERGITACGAEVVLNNVNMTGFVDSIKVTDHLSDGNYDSRVHLVDCDIVASDDVLWIYGNDGDSSTETTVIIERCSLEGTNYAGITCNGSYGNTNIQIIDSEVLGYYTAIYHPQPDSSMLISNSTLEGMTGLVVKGGTVDIVDSIIRGTGEALEPSSNASGFANTGDGVYLEGNYEWPAIINISGEKTLITSNNNLAVRLYRASSTTKEINISGGKYDDEDVKQYLVDGATITQTEDNYYTVTAP